MRKELLAALIMAALMALITPLVSFAGDFSTSFKTWDGVFSLRQFLLDQGWEGPPESIAVIPCTNNGIACTGAPNGDVVVMKRKMNAVEFQSASVEFEAPNGLSEHIVLGIQTTTPRFFFPVYGKTWGKGYFAFLGNDGRLGEQYSPFKVKLAIEKSWVPVSSRKHGLSNPNCYEGESSNCLWGAVDVTLFPDRTYRLCIDAQRISAMKMYITAYLYEVWLDKEILVATTSYFDERGDVDGPIITGREAFFASVGNDSRLYWNNFSVHWEP